jgi:hypothetical protein
MEDARRLMERKAAVEQELNTHLDYLNSVYLSQTYSPSHRLKQQGVGMDKSLVDKEDFPLPNIDLYAVRIARNRVHTLKGDHRLLMKLVPRLYHCDY